ncbi:MAG: PilZ domain-containing protein [Burkholderiaceae bacterium]|jgi:hypothetical protein|nr:PilZ domain-containing protein [Burkholderiaceae bacterium]
MNSPSDPSATAAWPLAGPAAAEAAPGLLEALRRCALCQHPVVLTAQPDARCPACHSPLAALPGHDGAAAHDVLGRRGAVRRDQSHVALIHVGWPSPAVAVRWRDLSLTGLSLYVPLPVAIGQRLRLIDSAIDGVAEVVRCRPQGRVQVLHARLLTAQLLQATGVFISATA